MRNVSGGVRTTSLKAGWLKLSKAFSFSLDQYGQGLGSLMDFNRSSTVGMKSTTTYLWHGFVVVGYTVRPILGYEGDSISPSRIRIDLHIVRVNKIVEIISTAIDSRDTCRVCTMPCSCQHR
jgi:hypothetical protein